MKNFVDVLKYVLEQETGEGEELEQFADQIYTSTEKPGMSFPAIILEGSYEEVSSSRNDAYILIDGQVDVLVVAKRVESGDWETAKEKAEIYAKKVRQVILAGGRLVTPDYSGGFLAAGHYQVSFAGRISYGYYVIDGENIQPAGKMTVQGRYQGTT